MSLSHTLTSTLRRSVLIARSVPTCLSSSSGGARVSRLNKQLASRNRGKNLRMTSKRGNRHFYKGRGVPSTGTRTKHGKFVVVSHKLDRLLFDVPDLSAFALKPYVEKPTAAYVRARQGVDVDE